MRLTAPLSTNPGIVADCDIEWINSSSTRYPRRIGQITYTLEVSATGRFRSFRVTYYLSILRMQTATAEYKMAVTVQAIASSLIGWIPRLSCAGQIEKGRTRTELRQPRATYHSPLQLLGHNHRIDHMNDAICRNNIGRNYPGLINVNVVESPY